MPFPDIGVINMNVTFLLQKQLFSAVIYGILNNIKSPEKRRLL